MNIKIESIFVFAFHFKELTIEIQTHRSLLDRLQLLSSTLISQVTDLNEREHIRHRLNEIIRRWTELEQNLIIEEEDITEMNNINRQYREMNSTCEHWLRQTRDLINELKHAKNLEILDQLIPKAKNALVEYQSNLDYLQRIRNRFHRIIQTNQTSEITQKV